MRGWASLFRHRGEPAPELYLPLEATAPPPASEPPTPEPPPPAAAPQPAEEGARELVLTIMRAAPDLRYRAARALGLLDGPSGGGPEFERRLLERARDAARLSALEEALRR